MTISSLGDCALVLNFGRSVDDETISRVMATTVTLREAAIAGVQEVVPAFSSVTVYYEPTQIGPFSRFEQRITELARQDRRTKPSGKAAVEIPVCYGGEYGPDLEEVAARSGLRLDAVIEAHHSAEYRVQAIGFVPGFAYLGGLPEALHVPRRASPRSSVPAGSVGIGGGQTGVYPLATPGGWNLIGRTPLTMFDPRRPVPARLVAGDAVRFRAITPEEFATWKSV